MARPSRRLVLVASLIGAAGFATWLLQPVPRGQDRLAAWEYPLWVVAFLVITNVLATGGFRRHRFRRTHALTYDRADVSFRDALLGAQREALALNHNYVGTEHLLLGLVTLPASPAGRLLSRAGVEATAIRSGIEKRIGRGDQPPGTKALGLSVRGWHAVANGLDRVPKRGAVLADDRHLLEGVLSIEDGMAGVLLVDVGCNLVTLRRAAAALARGDRAGPDQPLGSTTTVTSGDSPP